MNQEQLKDLHDAIESAEILMEREKAYALRDLLGAKTALDKALAILRDYTTDFPRGNIDWRFIHGSIASCLELASGYLDEFSEPLDGNVEDQLTAGRV